jgi:hypothetical protein
MFWEIYFFLPAPARKYRKDAYKILVEKSEEK